MWYIFVAIVFFALGVVFSDVTKTEVEKAEKKVEDDIKNKLGKS